MTGRVWNGCKPFLVVQSNMYFMGSSCLGRVTPTSLRSLSNVFHTTARPTLGQTLRRYSSSPNVDPKQQGSRRKALTILTYISGAIGAVMLTAVGAREYQRLKLRARGIEPIKNRQYGRKPYLYRYRGFYVPWFVANKVDTIHTFETRKDDTWVVSYPKSGTTWCQEIVYLIHSGMDIEGAETKMDDRFPYLEIMFPGIDNIVKRSSPRYIKTHLPLSLLPNDIKETKPKIVYIARNPKDTAVSFYHFSQKFLRHINNSPFTGTFDEYCQIFVDDKSSYGPWWKHVKEAWDRREEENILFVTYEDLQMDITGSIKKIADFLDKPLSQQQVEAIAARCSFEAMKNNSSVNYEWFKDRKIANEGVQFMRKGKVGDWRNHFSPEMAAKFDEMVATKLQPAGLVFKDSLEERSEE